MAKYTRTIGNIREDIEGTPEEIEGLLKYIDEAVTAEESEFYNDIKGLDSLDLSSCSTFNDKIKGARKVYIAGPISNDPGFFSKFIQAEEALINEGRIVINPAKLPAGLKQQEYMSICIPMLYACDAIYMLREWDNSVGACIEHDIAQQAGLVMIYQ